jgi:flavoprotein
MFSCPVAETVIKFYGLEEDLRKNFQKSIELNSNSPFLAG